MLPREDGFFRSAFFNTDNAVFPQNLIKYQVLGLNFSV